MLLGKCVKVEDADEEWEGWSGMDGGGCHINLWLSDNS